MRLAVLPPFLVPLLLAQLIATTTPSVCIETSPEGFGVVQYSSLTTINTSADVPMNRLVELNAGKGAVVPPPAECWLVSDDDLSYRFDLRQGMHFHSAAYFEPSRTPDADDVVFSFQHMLDSANLQHRMAQDGSSYARPMQLLELIKRVEKSGDYQVLIVLDHLDAISLSMLNMGFAFIYSTEYADRLIRTGTPEKLSTTPIGSGPFMFKHFQRDAAVRYAASPGHFVNKPTVDALIFATAPGTNVHLQKLRHGRYQIAPSSKPLDVESVRKDASLKVEWTPALMTAFVVPSTQHPLLDDPKVRQVINLTFDRTSYLQVVFEGGVSAVTDVYPPNTWSYARDIPAYPHYPGQARKLLTGKRLSELNIWTHPSGNLLSPDPNFGAQPLQVDLAEAGIKANIRVIEWGESIHRAKNGEHDLLFVGWAGDDGDPDDSLTPQFSYTSVKSGLNFARYCGLGLDKLTINSKTVSSREQRTSPYHQTQKLIHKQTL